MPAERALGRRLPEGQVVGESRAVGVLVLDPGERFQREEGEHAVDAEYHQEESDQEGEHHPSGHLPHAQFHRSGPRNTDLWLAVSPLARSTSTKASGSDSRTSARGKVT